MIAGISLISCESEYQKQLKQAKNLVQEELEIQSSSDVISDRTPSVHSTLAALHRDIAFRAHLSGNEDLFFRELDGYKHALIAGGQQTPPILITKFP